MIKLQGKQISDNTITQNNLNLLTPNSGDTKSGATVDYVNYYVDINKSVEHLSINNKDMAALSTVGHTGVTLACNTPILEQPLSNSYITVTINNIIVEVGPTKCCFFSGDSGITARNVGDAQMGDYLFWNMGVAVYALESDDRIDFDYIITSASSLLEVIDGGEI